MDSDPVGSMAAGQPNSQLRNEVLANYMEWGDRDEQDDPGAIELDDDGVVDTDDLCKSVATISETDDDDVC